LSRERRELPWERVEKEYVFNGPDGEQSLADLFDGRRQLVVYHFMFDPDAEWGEACKHCSFWVDNFDPIIVHLDARDVTMVAISGAELDKIARYRERMGWSFTWLSSHGNDFNFDYAVSFGADELEALVFNYGTPAPGFGDREGVSVFVKDGDEIFHAYSTLWARHRHAQHGLPLPRHRPQGRGEEGGPPQQWVSRHDEY